MAIHCITPNCIGAETENMFNITNTTGKNLIEEFAEILRSLDANWKGTDAVTNLGDLLAAYNVVSDFVKVLQNLVVLVNNEEVLPLQKEINSSGGNCTVGKELGAALNIPTVVVQKSAVETKVEPGIITDAENFNGFPDKLKKFVDELFESKDVLLNNWLDGSNRETVVTKFNEFKSAYEAFSPKIEQVRNNLNTVAENKRKFL